MCADTRELAERAADLAVQAIQGAVRARGVARVALSGGTTPLDTYARLAAAPAELAHVRWFWVDERAVPPDHPRSNHAAVRRALLGPARVPAERVFRIRGEAPPAEAARSYAELLAHEFGLARVEPELDDAGRCAVRFDLIVAGLGADGHTASLFPGSGSVSRRDQTVIAVDPGPELEPRVSLARPVLISALRTLLLCAGLPKRAALAAARTPGDEETVPARLFLAAERGSVSWIVDRAAAG